MELHTNFLELFSMLFFVVVYYFVFLIFFFLIWFFLKDRLQVKFTNRAV